MSSKDWRGFGLEIPFVELLGMELQSFENGQSQIFLPFKPVHENSFAVTHGGVLMTLLDVAMASAARSVEPGKGVLTIEMKTSFLRPAIGNLMASGLLLHRTAKLAFVEAKVLNAQQEICAHATGTFRYASRTAPVSFSISTD